MTPLRSDGHPDRRYGRPSGMVADGTKVDFFQPRWSCGHFSRIHRAPPPHRYHGAMHCALKVAA